MQRTNFSIIGSGYFIKLFDKNHPFYIALKNREFISIEQFILDISGFKSLQLKNENGVPYNSFFEIKSTETFIGYSTDAISRIELRVEGCKRIKIMFKDIVRIDYLFPPEFIITHTILHKEGLIIIENDRGHFGRGSIPHYFSKNDKLQFELLELPTFNLTCIGAIKIAGHTIKLKGIDTLNYGIRAMFL